MLAREVERTTVARGARPDAPVPTSSTESRRGGLPWRCRGGCHDVADSRVHSQVPRRGRRSDLDWWGRPRVLLSLRALPCWCSVVVSVESFSRSCRSASSLSSLSDLLALLHSCFCAGRPTTFPSLVRRVAVLRANLVSCDFYSLTCGISANLEAAKKSVSAFQCFSYTLFLFFPRSQAEGSKFFFSAVTETLR